MQGMIGKGETVGLAGSRGGNRLQLFTAASKPMILLQWVREERETAYEAPQRPVKTTRACAHCDEMGPG